MVRSFCDATLLAYHVLPLEIDPTTIKNSHSGDFKSQTFISSLQQSPRVDDLLTHVLFNQTTILMLWDFVLCPAISMVHALPLIDDL
jgi:hypothetical protein